MSAGNTIHCGDALDVLRTLPDESVQCCITSPPYWGLRDYGVVGQIGLERTPAEYVAKMVEVFREVRRVLRSDGTLWLNMGDSYASGKGSCFNPGGGESSFKDYRKEAGVIPLERLNISEVYALGLKPKDLCGIPWRVALALQADGWWLRQDIIWHKPNPMPESVTDRCTKAHEDVFLFVKSGSPQFWVHRERSYAECSIAQRTKPAPDYRWTNQLTGETQKARPDNWKQVYMDDDGIEHSVWTKQNLWRGCDYYYDAEAIKEDATCDKKRGKHDYSMVPGGGDNSGLSGGGGLRRINIPSGWDTSAGSHGTIHREGRSKPEYAEIEIVTRNRRSVWTVSTFAFPEAHFATFPPDLIKPMVMAGSRSGDIVLDPFMGAGTVALVAKELGRQYIGIELKQEYIDMANRRLVQEVMAL